MPPIKDVLEAVAGIGLMIGSGVGGFKLAQRRLATDQPIDREELLRKVAEDVETLRNMLVDEDPDGQPRSKTRIFHEETMRVFAEAMLRQAQTTADIAMTAKATHELLALMQRDLESQHEDVRALRRNLVRRKGDLDDGDIR